MALPLKTFAQTGNLLMSDDFEASNALNNWIISSGLQAELTIDASDPARHQMLKVTYPGSGIYDIERIIDPAIASQSNLVYEIEFYDDPTRNYATGFYVIDAANNYLGIYVRGNGGDYLIRNGGTEFDTLTIRTLGWHKFQIYVTEVGTYAGLDGQSFTFLRGKDAYLQLPTSYPINPVIKHLTKVGMDYPGWTTTINTSYWDNFKVYRLRPATESSISTKEKEEGNLIEFLNRYEPLIWNFNANQWTQEFIDARSQFHYDQNFQIAKLGIAAAYGVRGFKNNTPADTGKLKTLVLEAIDDYNNYNFYTASPTPALANGVSPTWHSGMTGSWTPGGVGNAHWEPAISGYMIALLSSWKWNEFNSSEQQKIADFVQKLTLSSRTITFDNPAAVLTVFPKWQGNTWAEEMSWNASLQEFAGIFLQSDSAGDWRTNARKLACNATSSTVILGGKYPYSCQEYPTLTPDTNFPGFDNFPYLVINHSVVNPSYTLTIPWGFSQATLFNFAYNLPIPAEYTYNLGEIYNRFKPLINFNNYTFIKHPNDSSGQANLIYNTGRDDWGQDGTLQDNGWAFFDKVLGTKELDKTVQYIRLTRASGTAYPAEIPKSKWITSESVYNNTASMAIPDSALFFFLNGMDAADRLVVLFMLDPQNYILQTVKPFCQSCPAGMPAKTLGNANCDGKINAIDFAMWKNVYIGTGLIPESVKAAVDFNCQAGQLSHAVDLSDFLIWAGNIR